LEITDKNDVRKACAKARDKGITIGFVPTMGALHEGHLSLVRKSKQDGRFTVVSIFVNPAQFGPDEDLEKYPRDYARDKNMLAECDVDFIYFPTNESLYSFDFSTWVNEDVVSKKLCGRTRKEHFRGVLTIVAKLFLIVMPDVAYFGQKDYQQAILIKKMVRELNFPVEIEVMPTIRESDGLAMSSRNIYLNPDQRRDALTFYRTLKTIEKSFDNEEKNISNLIGIGKQYFVENSGNAELEYLEILDSENLDGIENISGRAVVAIAGKVGQTRLIDNILLPDY
jgi:pantoate--beta-alanine ligase